MAASVPFSIPRYSPLARGWRAVLASLLDTYGLPEVWDAIAAYAELRQRFDNATYVDPYPFPQDSAAPVRRRVSAKEDLHGRQRGMVRGGGIQLVS